MKRGTTWSDDEKTTLRELWGTISVKSIANRLERSEYGVMNMAVRLQLGPFLDNGAYITMNQLLGILHGVKGANANSEANILKSLAKTKKLVKRNRFTVVDLNDFWKWAYINKRKIDFSKMQENALGKEPEWVKQKRKIDFLCRVRTEPWTKLEDAKLKRLLSRYRYTYTEIAIELQRSEGAIKRRIATLKLKERPMRAENRAWTEEETKKLLTMYDEGWSFDYIGKTLQRSGLACRGKWEHEQKPECFLRENRRKQQKKLRQEVRSNGTAIADLCAN